MFQIQPILFINWAKNEIVTCKTVSVSHNLMSFSPKMVIVFVFFFFLFFFFLFCFVFVLLFFGFFVCLFCFVLFLFVCLFVCVFANAFRAHLFIKYIICYFLNPCSPEGFSQTYFPNGGLLQPPSGLSIPKVI